MAANTAFVLRVPNERRAQAFGIASMGLIVGQGATFVAAGAAAELVTPAVVIAVAGGLGAAAALVLALSWRRVSRPAGAILRRAAHAHHEEDRSHNAGPGNGERVRTPLKSMCRALRFP